MSLDQERKMILNMVAEKKITVDEAEMLFKAIEDAESKEKQNSSNFNSRTNTSERRPFGFYFGTEDNLKDFLHNNIFSEMNQVTDQFKTTMKQELIEHYQQMEKLKEQLKDIPFGFRIDDE